MTTPTPQELLTLAEKLDAQVTEWELWRDNPTQAADDTAEKFYRATGIMAPYKSQPLEHANVNEHAERLQRYDEWMHEQKRERYTMLRQVAEAVRALAAAPSAGAGAQEKASPDVPSYGNALCRCGHTSARHMCDHETSDYSCARCDCPAFAADPNHTVPPPPPPDTLDREALVTRIENDVPRYRMTGRYGGEVRCEIIDTIGVGEWVRIADVLTYLRCLRAPTPTGEQK